MHWKAVELKHLLDPQDVVSKEAYQKVGAYIKYKSAYWGQRRLLALFLKYPSVQTPNPNSPIPKPPNKPVPIHPPFSSC